MTQKEVEIRVEERERYGVASPRGEAEECPHAPEELLRRVSRYRRRREPRALAAGRLSATREYFIVRNCRIRESGKPLRSAALLIGAALLLPLLLRAQSAEGGDSARSWSIHFQQTVVSQYHPDFSANYSGANSLRTHEPSASSITATLYIGRSLWEGGGIFWNPELSGGAGLSGARGIAGFPNGEIYRVGDPAPRILTARLFLRQTFPLSGERAEAGDEPNRIAGRQPASRLMIAAGKISVADYFDRNRYSNDARAQFLNWALMNSGAWDYAADTRGYTWGIVAEYASAPWALRIAGAMVPIDPNGSHLDGEVGRDRSEMAELERAITICGRPGALRLLGYATRARMGEYREALRLPEGPGAIAGIRRPGGTKYGVALSAEQQLSDHAGGFIRASWNDGARETWMFTEIDRSAAAGAIFDGAGWDRKDDQAGAALVVNGLSGDHRAFLEAGGNGFMLGDGALAYAPEIIGECFYSFSLVEERLWITGDYQFILHPGYNSDRGPAHVMGVRAHVEI